MKKAVFHMRKTFQRLLLTGSCFFLLCLSGCGLEVYPYLYAPYSYKSETSYSSSDYAQNYFSFNCNSRKENIDNNIKGTEVYYRIFNSLSKMSSFQSTISSQSSTGNAANTLINTQKYSTLKISTGSYTPLIRIAEDNYVYIRLSDKNDSDFRASICVCPPNEHIEMYNETYALKYKDEIVFPRRNVDSNLTFNFGGSNPDTDKVPVKGDEDVEWSDTTSEEDEGKWYVDMYAVSVGVDISTWTSFYSELLHLGSVTIVEGEDN